MQLKTGSTDLNLELITVVVYPSFYSFTQGTEGKTAKMGETPETCAEMNLYIIYDQ